MDLITGILLGLLLKDDMWRSVEAQTFELPKTMKTLEGSCVVIPCKFTIAKPKPVIQWLKYSKSNRGEIYNSKNSSSVLKSFLGRVSLVGDLAKGNCTIRINNVSSMDGGLYFPQIDSDPPTWKEESDENVPLYINNVPDPSMIYGPDKPMEGNTYVFTCDAKHTCPANLPTLTWNFRNLPAKTHHRELGNGVWETVSKLTFKADSEDNGKALKCFAEYPNNKKTGTLRMLNILYPPKMVSVQSTHETGHVRKGDKFALICQGYGNPNITNYTWYKNNQTVFFGHTIKVLHMDGMTEDKSGQYYCLAGNDIGETKSEPITLICVDCASSHIKAVVAAVVMVVLVIILAVVIVMWYRRKRASRPPNPETEEASRCTNVYMNVMVPHDPKPVVESPYAALQTDNRCPDYEQLQPQNIQATNKPPFHTSPSYSLYEEVVPFRSLQNKK
ncbi:B-cell receptor CD22-like [Rana temporaria]|uniref:B-cell receptor CD22-like n=1 Tax=Rana temporaria TaxID=8407 RepID=UPI001AAC63C0|nr:B-cell receptor CD22-like [Rana temporaria]